MSATMTRAVVLMLGLLMAACPKPQAMNVCGDGSAAGDETCDDGNTVDGDGCSAACKVEPRCGDSNVDANETCDDGNTTSGDGCSAACKVEPRCGDARLEPNEACDDGNTAMGDGCSASCAIEAGFTCTGTPSVCTTRCSDGVPAGLEGCDDGNAQSGDGCSANCVVEPGFSCGGAPSRCSAGCGDGAVTAPETCDDGNLAANDGCSPSCRVENGFTCTQSPSRCTANCGDGLVATTEGCDDGNTRSNDGCSPTCTPEPGFTCTGAPSVCAPGCGDGVVAGSERCDDGNPSANDGCTACQVDPGFTCTGAPSTCSTTCGDGRVGGAERCDDNGTSAGDGCDATCQVEPGFLCTGAPSACAPRCSDGLITGGERCDDGNLVTTDGCDGACRVTTGFTCMGQPSLCRTTCGDGIVAGVEACDDMNPVRFDGCDSTCRVDRFDEVEPNGTFAQANGPFRTDVAIRGAIGPLADDLDLFTFTVSRTSDLTLETFDETGPGRCQNIDTELTLYGPGGVAVIATDDDDGLGRCSKLSSRKTAALRRLPPGDYVVEVRAWSAFRRIPEYRLVVTTDASCGDGRIEGSEQCDGSATCSSTCTRVPTCGDSFVDGTEQCDDGNGLPNDGCSAACALELRAEVEPNGTTVTASGPFAVDALLSGAITPAGDQDLFAITLAQRADLVIETFDGSGPGSCLGIDTVVTLLSPSGTPIATRDQGGLGNCAALDPSRQSDAALRQLAPGTYFLRVNEHLDDGTIPAYRVRVTQRSRCGNGVVEGFEACDGSMGCTAQCTRTPVCGDGFIDGSETCDDGNTASSDGCSQLCVSESVLEVEPNGTSTAAAAPRTPFAQWQGSISTPTDLDVFAITIPAIADLAVETFDLSASTCLDMDTTLTLYASNGTTVLLTKTGGGPGLCAAIDPRTDVAARQLAPGTYFVRVEDAGQNTTIPGYVLRARLDSRCGNSTVEGFEQCDGAAGCAASCRFQESCGNGFVEGSERCDDGNTASSDGCSMTCAIERLEAEPNDTVMSVTAAMPLAVPGWGRGAITANDVDTWRFVLATAQVVQLETSDASAAGCAIQTTLSLLDGAGATLLRDDNSGVASCSAITAFLPAGTYFAQVRGRTGTTAFADYTLTLRSGVDAGNESEPNELRSSATALTGTNVIVLGSHQQNTDVDVFSITVPAGRSLRVELLEGGAETCESLGIDSMLTLFTSTGLALGWDDDSGRGYCSLIDGTGQLPVNGWANLLPAGTYFVQVEAASFAQLGNDPRGQFDYRLVISTR